MIKTQKYDLLKLVIIILFTFLFFGSCSISEKDVLTNIRITDRISSNHYSEIVMDSQGNSYIASFYKNQANKDFISISKVDSYGKVLWDLGNNTEGRATSISIDKNDNIWVVGYFNKVLNFGESFLDSENDAGFLTILTPTGQCNKILKIAGNSIPYNIQVNGNDKALISGVLGQEINISGMHYNRKNEFNSEFVALLNTDGSCFWIKEIQGQILRIKDNDNDFILGGTFFNNMSYESDTLKTKGTFDVDGFLIKLDSVGHKLWWRQIGDSIVFKDNFRSKDGVHDFIIDQLSGDILSSVIVSRKLPIGNELLQDKYPMINDHFVQRFSSDDGKLLNTHLISSSLENYLTTISHGKNNSFWVSGAEVNKENLDLKKGYLNNYIASGELIGSIPIESNKYFLIRSAYGKNNKTVFAGHYKESLSLNKFSITTKRVNTLFFYSIK